MQKQSTPMGSPSSQQWWEHLEDVVRGHIQRFIQSLWEEEVTERVGRKKSVRRAAIDAPGGIATGTAGRGSWRSPAGRSPCSGRWCVAWPSGSSVASCRCSNVGPSRSVSCCRNCICTGWHWAISSWRCGGCWARGAPLSPASLQRLTAQWPDEDEAWQRRRDELEVAYGWADGLYVKAGLEAGQAARLVLIGALTDGRKVGLAVESGQHESKESWGAVLRDLRARGLKPWRGTVADGHPGIRAALAEQQPPAAEQRCGNHRIVNVLDAIPKTHQFEASTGLKTMPYAETHVTCERLRDQFSRRDRTLAPKAVERVPHDWERLVTFYQFPEGPLAASAHDERGRVAVRRCAAADDGRQAVQARGVGDGLDHLESPAGRGADLPAAECTGVAPGCLCRPIYVDGMKQHRTAPQEVAA